MNRGRVTPQPQQSPGISAAAGVTQQGLAGVPDQTSAGAIYCLFCLPRTPIGAQVFPAPPSNPFYPLILGF